MKTTLLNRTTLAVLDPKKTPTKNGITSKWHISAFTQHIYSIPSIPYRENCGEATYDDCRHYTSKLEFSYSSERQRVDVKKMFFLRNILKLVSGRIFIYRFVVKNASYLKTPTPEIYWDLINQKKYAI